jgi:CheY-like chemotaxis protein
MAPDAKTRLLIVEDSPMLIEALQTVLESDFVLDFATSGREALTKLLEISFDGVLLDYQLPGLDGFETLLCIRSQTPALPVIVMSGYDVERVAFRYGANAFLAKPFSTEALKEHLTTYVQPRT